MNPDEVLADYEDAFATVAETIAIRIYTGTGPGRTYVDHSVRARVMDFAARDLVGPLVQGDRKVVASAADVTAAGITLTTGANCKAVVRGKELQIKSIDDNTRRGAGAFAAYILTVNG